MSAPTRLAQRASELRLAFDRSFAEQEAAMPPAQLDLLAIQVAGHGYVLRLAEVASLHADRKVVPVPSPRRELLGLVGVRGLTVPVYDLRQLLGHEPGQATRWVALVRAATPFAVAFEKLETHLRVEQSGVLAAPPGDSPSHPLLSGSVGTAMGPRPLIDLPALVAGVTRTRRASAPEGEGRR
jgi:chemotaxis signal transduction protein